MGTTSNWEDISEDNPLRCPEGHDGPWLFVETNMTWQEVLSLSPDAIVVNREWEQVEWVFPHPYLECQHWGDSDQPCRGEVFVPIPGVDIEVDGSRCMPSHSATDG